MVTQPDSGLVRKLTDALTERRHIYLTDEGDFDAEDAALVAAEVVREHVAAKERELERWMNEAAYNAEQVSHLRTALGDMTSAAAALLRAVAVGKYQRWCDGSGIRPTEDDVFKRVQELMPECAALAEGTTEFDEEPISADQVRERLGLSPREP